MSEFATAEQIASAVYSAMTVQADDHYTVPDGVESIRLGGWTLRVFNDVDEFAPHGISWWLDSPDEVGVESDGWEQLPADQIEAEALKLAELLERQAQA